MNLKKYLLLIFFLLFIFQGCSFKNGSSTYPRKANKTFPNRDNYNYQITKDLDYEKLYQSLKSYYKSWKGVRYKYGGDTKNGIDCSAFVQRAFKDALNIKIPRTTTLQSKIGKEISRNSLEMGDLIFFKTGFKSKHVGIYLEGGKFLHASTSKGVTISRLDNPYYSKHFWKIKRVLY